MNQPETRKLAGRTRPRRNAMIMAHYPLVQSIAYRLVGRFPANVDVDDLINVGTLGLIDAIDRFSLERQRSFKTYAELRIRGSIIDELRQMDWVPRSVRQKIHDAEQARRTLQNELDRKPTDSEMAERLNLTLDEYLALVKNTAHTTVVSIEDLGNRDDGKRDIHQLLEGDAEDPACQLENKTTTESLESAISALPARQQTVVQMYYYDELTLRQIGEALEITESRVSQIHAAAVRRLRKKLHRQTLAKPAARQSRCGPAQA